MSVKARPDGYHSVTPYLICRNAAAAIEYYKEVFEAEELMRLAGPDGKVMHAEIKIGDSPIMLADEFPEMDFLSPESLEGSPVSMLVYVDDADAVFQRALDKGGRREETNGGPVLWRSLRSSY